MLELEPFAKSQWRSLYRELIAQDEIVQLGRARPAGRQTLYVAQRGDAGCPLRGVMVADLADPERPLYIHARCGALLEGTGDDLRPRVELAEGSIHFGGSVQERYRKLEFGRLSLTFDLSLVAAPERRLAGIDLDELREVDRRLVRGEDAGLRRAPTRAQVQSEIQRRIAFPLASLALPSWECRSASARAWDARRACSLRSCCSARTSASSPWASRSATEDTCRLAPGYGSRTCSRCCGEPG